ncbi:hypothetical protein ACIQF6_02200 [Kitasatospora sp. NPDC092948]|uniref:hypothetical protein n=1 Tax=Kitasatospora sp. NPDC092948 TaxID=3364088 RepID=UPI003807654C
MRLRKLIAAAGVAGTVAGLGLVPAGEASAVTADCSGSQFVCLYYQVPAGGYGATFKQTFSIPDYAPYVFTGPSGSAGVGVSVRNHVGAVDSWYSGTFTIYYNTGYICAVACQSVPAMATVDLNSALKNNNASGALN